MDPHTFQDPKTEGFKIILQQTPRWNTLCSLSLHAIPEKTMVVPINTVFHCYYPEILQHITIYII